VALMPDITPSDKRSEANGIINLMGGIGGIIAFLVGASLYEMNPAYPFWLGSGLVIISALLVFIFIKEPKEYTETTERPDILKGLKQVFAGEEKSPLFILLAIFCWFVGYNAVEAFFTLYAVNHLGMSEADGTRLLGQMALTFVLMAFPAGLIGGSGGRKRTIMTGVTLLGLLILSMFLLPADFLTISLTKLPVLGNVPVVGVILMLAGISWALININSLPMVVDMTENALIGTYTGMYYLFSTAAAIVGPNVNGLLISAGGENYALVMVIAPVFMVLAFIMMTRVKRGEPKREPLSE